MLTGTLPAVRVFANGPVDLGSIPGRVIPKTLKMVLDTTLLNTQHYKVLFKVKWSNPGNGVAPSPTLGVVAIEKGAFGSPSTMSLTLTFYIYMLYCQHRSPDPFSPLISIVHRSRYVFKAISCIGTELLSIGSSCSSCHCSSM